MPKAWNKENGKATSILKFYFPILPNCMWIRLSSNSSINWKFFTDALSTLPLKLSTNACTSITLLQSTLLTFVPFRWLVEKEHHVFCFSQLWTNRHVVVLLLEGLRLLTYIFALKLMLHSICTNHRKKNFHPAGPLWS